MLNGHVILNNQEQEGNYRFTGIRQYMTAAFKSTFGNEAESIIFTAIALILEKYPHNADYLQTFDYIKSDGTSIRFWIINDIDYLTALLPSDY